MALPRARLDLTDPASIDRGLGGGGFDVVINTAAISRLEVAEADPERARAVNATGAGALAEACRRASLPLIHISTDYVFGAPTARPWREDDPVSPVNAYGRTKAEGEARVLDAGGHVVRVAWLFGDGEDFIAAMLRAGKAAGAVTVAGDQVGSPTPMPILVERLRILCGRLAARDRILPRVLHLAGSPPVARADWIEAAFDLIAARGGSPPRLDRAPTASFPSTVVRPHYSALDTALAASLFGAPIDWRAGLADAVARGVY